MVLNTNITLVTTNTNISTTFNTYLVNGTGGTGANITLTLPAITNDGMNYIFNRIESLTNVGITGSNVISGFTASYALGTGAVGMQSRNSQWFPFTYSDSPVPTQIFQFSLPASVSGTNGFPSLMGVNATNPPTNIGGLVPISGGYNGIACSPWYMPWATATVTNVSCKIAAGAVAVGTVVYPVSIRLELLRVGYSAQTSVATLNIVISPTGTTAGSPTGVVNTFDSLTTPSELSGHTGTSIALTRGLYGIKFINVPLNSSVLDAVRSLFGSVSVTGTLKF